MSNLPIIRLEVDRMKYTIQTIISQHASEMDEGIQRAVDEYCTPENIQRVVTHEVDRCAKACISEAVHDFFGYNGLGKQVIKDEITARLEAMFKDRT